MSNFQKLYNDKIVKALKKQFSYKSVMQVPRVTKITLNMGLGAAMNDKKIMDAAIKDLTIISGQKPVKTYARTSIAGFKLRAGWPVGCKVTLRKERMYEFLERLICIAIPRIRDFRGMSVRSFDGHGNYSLGISEQIIFPEVDYDKIDATRGLDVTITTNARSTKEAWALLAGFHFPFKEKFEGDKIITDKQGK
jgi:large subunit ribosomal protein L5